MSGRTPNHRRKTLMTPRLGIRSRDLVQLHRFLQTHFLKEAALTVLSLMMRGCPAALVVTPSGR